jgi:hypothetical protein
MNRITDKQLDALCDYLNKITGNPITPYNGHGRANVGNYHISHAYGGVCLHKISNDSGGVSCPLTHGVDTKRALYNSKGLEVQS